MEYRGIQLDESVKLYKKNGEYNLRTKSALDNLVDKLEESNYKLIGLYVNVATKIKGLCDKKHEIEIQPNNFVTKYRRCFKCSGYCPEEAKKNFYKKVKEAGYRLLGDYTKAIEKVDVVCDKGHYVQITPSTFMSYDARCTKCAYIEQSIRQSEIERKNFPLLVESNGHILLTPYGKNCEDNVLIDFKCKHKPSSIKPTVYKRNSICPKCSIESGRKKRLKKSEKEFVALIRANKHVLLSPFIKVSERVLIDFKCNHTPHWITPHKYKLGGGCPFCTESKGVKIIREWLDENKIDYETEYYLPQKKWRYDIYIPRYNLLVEVQGLQHYEFVEHFHRTKKTFVERQEIDRKKREYVELVCYEFIEVDYREHKPELALERFLQAFNELRRKFGLKELA